jgi:hypothetical protein
MIALLQRTKRGKIGTIKSMVYKDSINYIIRLKRKYMVTTRILFQQMISSSQRIITEGYYS